MKNYRLYFTKISLAFCFLGSLIVSAGAQSIYQNSPTPITTNEISGRIPARDIGDARLTSYFYTFDGKQGDVFINVVTTNFNGDIDVFTADNLRPLTKITVYADSSNNETGRVVYLRQPTKLILRIEGRTPNDDAATFQMKFAGSFAPSTAVAEADDTPVVKSSNETDVRVNSVGTIIEVKPKPTPTPKGTVAKVEKPIKQRKPKAVAEKIEKTPSSEMPSKPETVAASENKVKETTAETEPKESVTPETTAEVAPKKEETPTDSPNASPKAVVNEESSKKDAEIAEINKAESKKEPEIAVKEKKPEKKEASVVKASKEKKKSNAVQPVPTAALENINLVILFKDGSKIERPMSDVLKVGVDKGILTVISKDGAIGRYSILDVEKMTIQ